MSGFEQMPATPAVSRRGLVNFAHRTEMTKAPINLRLGKSAAER